jgi:carboxypeptidase C (cathepsin A)
MAIDELYTEVVNFAKQKYYPALQQEIAGTLVFAQRSDIAKSLSAYTGIPESKFEDSITLSASEFSRLLLATENTDVGLYDGRYTLPSAGNGYEPVADDAAMGQYTPAFVATFHQMQYEGLKVAMCRPYNIIVWKDLNFNWSYNRKGRISSQGFAYELAMAMRRNADLKIFVASGYYDLVTTAAAAENSIIMAAVPGDRVFFKNYESGHMLYIGSTASQFAENVRKFITTGSI